MDNGSTKYLFISRAMIGNLIIDSMWTYKLVCVWLIYSYTFAGDICIIKVYFDTCDKPRLSPIRVIIDEITAQNGQLPDKLCEQLGIKLPFLELDKPNVFLLLWIWADACYIFGYGSETISGLPTLDLRLAPVKIISHESCLNELGPWNAPEQDSGMFCAVGEYPGVDACPVSRTF